TDRSGTTTTGTDGRPLGNQMGVYIFNAPANTIGDFTSPAGVNVISGNTQQGVLIEDSHATGNVVQGNFIGTDAAGFAALSSGAEGVEIVGAFGNLIGGTAGVRRFNIIAGNGSHGVSLNGAAGNLVLGNNIGANMFDASLGNNGAGVNIQDELLGGVRV